MTHTYKCDGLGFGFKDSNPSRDSIFPTLPNLRKSGNRTRVSMCYRSFLFDRPFDNAVCQKSS
uniref:Uncharacterized protein n=1 Tax=Anopheles atroparvus TaxID=41427 RepID=A0AAG5DPH7_ANOAO